jgi:putative spermidine/putrescine transport system substrate-binding protein
MKKLFSTVIVAVLSAMFMVGSFSIVPAQADELVVICYGGTFEQGWRKAVIDRFEKKYPGDKIRIATGLTMQVAAKMRAQKGNVEIDVVMMDQVGATQSEAEGLYEQLTAEKVPNLNNLLPMFKKNQAGHNWTYFFWEGEILAYNTEKVTPAPTSWQALFDPKYAGHIAFPDINTSHGVWMLNMAARINGGSEQNIDPGFAAIKNVRDGIHTFWTKHGQLQQLFAQEEVWITSWTSDRLAPLMVQGLPVDWVIPDEGAYLLSSTIGIAKGTKNPELAYRYINFVLDAETQALIAKYTYLAPVVKGAPVDAAMVKAHLLPAAEDLDKLIDLDWPVVNKNRPDWTDRWRREIAIK